MNKYDYSLDLENKNVLSIIAEKINKNSEVLEFGSANGRLTRYLKQEKNCVVDIVEIDKISGNEAAQYARNSFIGSLNGNAENYIWEKELDSKKYDYIVFADVLEHLYCPEQLLRECKNFLKEDGRIFVSIPNIAHNDILTNLYYNKFNYTSIGLLDDTHIRFWGLDNFIDLIKKIDLILNDIDCIEIPKGSTEQKKYFDTTHINLEDMLFNREYGDVYQYVFEIKNNGIKCGNILDSINKYKKHRYPIKLYFDDGNGYCEENKIIEYVVIGEKIKKKFNIDKKIKNAKLNLINEMPCSVRIINIKTNIDSIILKPINFTLQINGGDEFLNLNPIYEILGELSKLEWIEVDFEIQKIGWIESTQKLLEVNMKKTKLLKQTENELKQTENELKQTENELKQTENELKQTENELRQTENELRQTENELEGIITSKAWKFICIFRHWKDFLMLKKL